MGWIKKHALGITIFSALSVMVALTIGHFLNEAKKHEEEEQNAQLLLLKKKAG